MAGRSPEQTLAVLLGASWFERARQLAQGPPFANSAQDFREYLLSEDGMRLPRENLHWLFDDTRSPSDQLASIGDFLLRRTRELTDNGTPARNVILYYVGHGMFCGAEHAYHLAIRATDDQREGLTSLRFSDLASVIKDQSRFARRFLILDSCFSSVAYREFQSGPLQAGLEKVMAELPSKGTTLLCSASAQDASRAPKGLGHTMFSDSLLRALRQGHRDLGTRLSFSELGDLIKVELRSAYPEDWVRPEIHSPDQREGNIADVALFPNPALQEGDCGVAESEPALVPLDPRPEPDVTRQPQARGSEVNPSQRPRARIPEASVERPAGARTADPALRPQTGTSGVDPAPRQAERPSGPRPPQQQGKARASSVDGQREGSGGKKRWRVIRWLGSHRKLAVVMVALLIAIIAANLAEQTTTTTSSSSLLQPASTTPLLQPASPPAKTTRPKPPNASAPSETRAAWGARHRN
jgi:hypothetical protein